MLKTNALYNKEKYIIRLDDACPTMDKLKWKLIEDICDNYEIKPLVAVVPDNQDNNLNFNEADEYFWNKVREWHNKGWTIAMHGYQHKLELTTSKSILPFYKHSEFTGLSLNEQILKIRKSWNIFKANGIEPLVWIAPAHCFDIFTLQALYRETSIRIISDGIARNIYYESNFFWIPQQLWTFKLKNSGLWTVCFHPNSMSNTKIKTFEDDIKANYKDKIISVYDIIFYKRNRNLYDEIENFLFWRRNMLSKIITYIKYKLYG